MPFDCSPRSEICVKQNWWRTLGWLTSHFAHYKASWTHQTFHFFKPRHCLQRQAQHPLHESSQSMSLIYLYQLSILRTFRSCNQRMMLWTMRPLIDLSVKALNEPVRICLSCHKSAHFCALLLALESWRHLSSQNNSQSSERRFSGTCNMTSCKEAPAVCLQSRIQRPNTSQYSWPLCTFQLRRLYSNVLPCGNWTVLCFLHNTSQERWLLSLDARLEED